MTPGFCFQFAEEFRDQFTSERLDYMNEIEHNIRSSVDDRYKKGQGPSGRMCIDLALVETLFLPSDSTRLFQDSPW